jgi:hypothetical protein
MTGRPLLLSILIATAVIVIGLIADLRNWPNSYFFRVHSSAPVRALVTIRIKKSDDASEIALLQSLRQFADAEGFDIYVRRASWDVKVIDVNLTQKKLVTHNRVLIYAANADGSRGFAISFYPDMMLNKMYKIEQVRNIVTPLAKRLESILTSIGLEFDTIIGSE